MGGVPLWAMFPCGRCSPAGGVPLWAMLPSVGGVPLNNHGDTLLFVLLGGVSLSVMFPCGRCSPMDCFPLNNHGDTLVFMLSWAEFLYWQCSPK